MAEKAESPPRAADATLHTNGANGHPADWGAVDVRERADEIRASLDEEGRDPDELDAIAVEMALAEVADSDGPAEVRIVTVEEFASVEEPGAEPLVGSPGNVIIPTDADVMLYGDGGASKTTLAIDLGYHLGAGDDWLGFEIPESKRVLIVEAEGPRPLFRDKMRRKINAWTGSALGDRVLVWEEPWARFRFPNAEEIARKIGGLEVDVLIVGPLTAVGWDDLGTLQEVRAFMGVVAGFRQQTGHPLTTVQIHHENKGGKVSGAFEGAGETLLHAEVRSRGKTHLTFQKARWASEWHKQTLELEWTDGEGFEPIDEPDRDLVAEITAWLLERPEHRHSTYKEIASGKRIESSDGVETLPGIGANDVAVRDALEDRQDLFQMRKGEQAKAVGRHQNAKVWDVKEQGDNESLSEA